MMHTDFRPGTHLLADLYDCDNLMDADGIESVLRKAAGAAGATILLSHVHAFPSAGGVTGVVLLAESHISIHTWPEHGFAALDIFMCGSARAEAALEVVRAELRAGRVRQKTQRRGVALT
jgi:S-adenosylmethionine decarboxylase